MTILATYENVRTYRATAAICGTTPKTVKRVIERAEAGDARPPRTVRRRNYADVADLVAERVQRAHGPISAKRLLPAARAAGYAGSKRNFRRLVAAAKTGWRGTHHGGRCPAVWSPGEHLVIHWGVIGGVHVFCAVLAWSRWRFVRFAKDEKAATTLGMLAECFTLDPRVEGCDSPGFEHVIALSDTTASLPLLRHFVIGVAFPQVGRPLLDDRVV